MLKYCKTCDKYWQYPLDICIFCGMETSDVDQNNMKVIGITEINIPSAEHTTVPYFVLLLSDQSGNLVLQKTNRPYKIGDELFHENLETKPLKIGVFGTGVMGAGIVEVALQSGCEVVWGSRSAESLDKALKKVEKNILKNTNEQIKNVLMKNLQGSTTLDPFSEIDFFIESIIEDLAAKKLLLAQMDNVCRDNVIFASNTSSLSIDELGAATSRSDRIIGLHFFNPVPRMQLAEVIIGRNTSKETIQVTKTIAEKFNKIVVTTKDSPGFIVNRILMPYLNEAALLYEENIATREDIDKAIRLGLNHPMGPLMLLDLIGLDVFLSIMNTLYAKTKDPKFIPARITQELFEKNKLGRKTGEGFYNYDK